MRVVAAIAGILVGLPTLIFFWIGTQTFVRPLEKALAYAVTFETGALLLLSLMLLFTASVQRPQAVLLGTSVVTIAVILIAHRLHLIS